MDGFRRASMRPGQTAPECAADGDSLHHHSVASMRPGQTAPECALRNKQPEGERKALQ